MADDEQQRALIVSEPDFQRFLARVEFTEECWNWTGNLDRKGYGVMAIGKIPTKAHRIAYTVITDAIPCGLVIDHLCRNRRCVNPDHLEPVTQEENKRRGVAARTHCKHGHEYTAENTITSRGFRECRTCDRLRGAMRNRNGRNRYSQGHCPGCQCNRKAEQ